MARAAVLGVRSALPYQQSPNRAARSLVEWSDSGKLLSLLTGLDRAAYLYGRDSGDLSYLWPALTGVVPTYPIPAARHFPMLDNPAEFWPTVARVLRAWSRPRTPAPVYVEVASSEWGEWQGRIRSAVATFDAPLLERLYGQVFSTYPLLVVFQEVFMPLWQELLLRRDEPGQVSEWLFLDAFLRARALQRLQLGGGQTRVLLAALPGHCRELELLVAGLLLGNEDLGIQVLGPGQPLEELPLVCTRVRPQALVLFSNQPPADDLGQQLRRLALALDCPLALCGEGSELGRDSLAGTPIACLGTPGPLMQRRLAQFLAGHLDT